MKQDNKKLKEALLKLATGFSYSEVTEEFCPKKDKDEETQKLELAKRKITTHYVPPDMLAIKMLLQDKEGQVTDYAALSDDELIKLKDHLVKEFISSELNKKTQNLS